MIYTVGNAIHIYLYGLQITFFVPKVIFNIQTIHAYSKFGLEGPHVVWK